MVSEAQKAASAKWNKENMTVLGCKVTKKKADEFREACKKLELVPNQVFRQTIDQVIENAKKE